MDLTIIIVSYNTKDVLKNCLNLVYENLGKIEAEVIVADNASKDGSAGMVEEDFPQVKLIRTGRNYGFGKGNNIAMEQATGEYFLLLNSDAYIKPGVLESTLKYMKENPKTGALGVKLVGEDGYLQPSARCFPTPFYKFTVLSGISSRFPHSKLLGGPDYSWWDHSSIKAVDWVVGAYLLIRKDVIEEADYFDERYFLYYEETDLCLQVKKLGYVVIFYPHAEVVHLGGESSKKEKAGVSEFGRQITRIRIDSEQKYHWKNFGKFRLKCIVNLDITWHKLLILRNKLMAKNDSEIKIKNAKLIIELHKSNLKNKNYLKTSYDYA